MIVTNIEKLKEKCLPTSLKEGEEIGIKLLQEIRNFY